MKEDQPRVNVRSLRKILIIGDDIMHFIVAATLLVCAALVLVKTLPNLLHPDISSVLHVLNDVLLVLIIMELLWPIIRFLQRKPFILNPFLYIGIISSIRRILLIEAEHSMISRIGNTAIQWHELWPVLAELGVNVLIILVLAIALRILAPNGCDQAKMND
ncbi:MAG: hypothetical protein KKE17_04560 [Proteobacteria bacterium]|nr:hypothetical protein [Pseudomonadota bacterium]MBU1709259.1 hypothetical protein [Pseudomonadota bacterium]